MDKYGYVWKMCVACTVYVGLTWMCLKSSGTERQAPTVQKGLDIKTCDYSEFLKLVKFEILLYAALCGFVTNIKLIFLLLMTCSV